MNPEKMGEFPKESAPGETHTADYKGHVLDVYKVIELANVKNIETEDVNLETLSDFKNNNHWDTSNVLYKNGQLIEYNKQVPTPEMHYIDYGLSVLTKSVFEWCPEEQPFDLAQLYHQLSLQNLLAGIEVHERFYEIGSYAGLNDTELYFKGKINP